MQHEIVHNKHVVQRLRNEGAVFVENIDEIPEGSHAIYSAHGVSPEVRRRAEKRKLIILDATCPLVTKVHGEAQRYAQKNHTIILIGHHNHVEVQGTVGEAPEHIFVIGTPGEVADLQVPDESKVGYITQTTLSLDDTAEIISALKKRYPEIQGPAKEQALRKKKEQALRKKEDQVLRKKMEAGYKDIKFNMDGETAFIILKSKCSFAYNEMFEDYGKISGSQCYKIMGEKRSIELKFRHDCFNYNDPCLEKEPSDILMIEVSFSMIKENSLKTLLNSLNQKYKPVSYTHLTLPTNREV